MNRLQRRISAGIVSIFAFSVVFTPTFAQKKSKSNTAKPAPAATSTVIAPAKPKIDPVATEAECKAYLQFLASDKLQGRMTGEAGNNAAAAYIAEHFNTLGLKPVVGQNSFIQPIELRRSTPPNSFTLILAKDTLRVGVDAMMMSGDALKTSAEVAFVGFGIIDTAAKRNDYAGMDVKGKIVIARLGANDSTKPRESLAFSRKKREAAIQRGAVAFIELMNFNAPPMWASLREFNKRPSLQLQDTNKAPMPYFIVKDMDKRWVAALEAAFTAKKALSASIATDGIKIESTFSQNVVAFLQGADTALAREYVIVSAHYDHIGVAHGTGQADSIYNGARDNGMGVTALLATAKALAAQPPARSVLFIAFTGEEVGLLGSRYYAEHPLLPLNQAVFNLNTDGAGFNDTTAITVIGLERTSVRGLFEEAAQKNGLRATPDPAPEQGLFDRSDNVSFAIKGIPAPTFTPGLKAFDADIFKNYHQVSDEAGEDFNFAYLTRYVNTFLTVSRLVANAKERPRWMTGDKYEAAFQALYSGK